MEIVSFILLVISAICFVITVYLINKQLNQLSDRVSTIGMPTITKVDLDLSELYKRLDQLPLKLNQSITASASHHKGSLGELIAYIQLNSQYDRILPIGDVVDFLGIRFPRDGDPGTIDFIDVKNGPSAGLNKNQKTFKKLVESSRPQFVVTTFETSIT